MYGDHHVIEVRRILLELPGVEDVYASSAFQIAEITYDPAQIEEDAITTRLDEAGYLGELDITTEPGTPATQRDGGPTFFRHTTAFEATGNMVSFAQNVPYAGRPLWPCPGVGTIKTAKQGD